MFYNLELHCIVHYNNSIYGKVKRLSNVRRREFVDDLAAKLYVLNVVT